MVRQTRTADPPWGVRGGVACVILLLAVLFSVLFAPFLAGQKTLLFRDIGSDSVNHVYPMLVHVSDYLRSDGFPRWSFAQGLGQSLISRDLGDPFNWLLFIMPRDWIAVGMAWVEALKLVLAGLLFYLYLREIPLSRYASLFGGMCFAFCGYAVVVGGIQSTEAVFLALLLWAYERCLTRGRWALLPPAFSLAGALQPLDLYFFGLVLVFYSAVRFLERGAAGWWSWPAHMARVAGLALLGAAMSSVVLWGNLEQILQSPRGAGGASHAKFLLARPLWERGDLLYYFTALSRFFSTDLAGVGSLFRGWYNYYEAPFFYAGLPLLLLAPWFILHLDRRRRRIYMAAAVLALLPTVWPYARYALWLFTGNYFRLYALLVAAGLIFLAARGLEFLKTTHKADPFRLALILGVLWLLLLWPGGLKVAAMTDPAVEAASVTRQPFLNQPLAWGLAGLLGAYAVTLAGFASARWRRAAAVLFLTLLGVELIGTSAWSMYRRPVISGKQLNERVGYNDYTMDAIRFLKQKDSGFFRVAKEYSSGLAYHTSLNDAKVQGYYGLTSYNSFNHMAFIEFLRELGVMDPRDEYASRWAHHLLQAPMVHPMLSANYWLTKNPRPEFEREGYLHLGRFQDVHVYQNPFGLPFGFTYGYGLRYGAFHGLQAWEKPRVMWRAAVLPDDAVIGRLPLWSGPVPGEDFDQRTAATQALRQEVLRVDEFHQNRIHGSLELTTTKLLFISIPFDAGWRARVNGQPARLLRANIGFMGLILDPGRYDILLTYQPSWWKIGFAGSVAGWAVYGILRRRRPILATWPGNLS